MKHNQAKKIKDAEQVNKDLMLSSFILLKKIESIKNLIKDVGLLKKDNRQQLIIEETELYMLTKNIVELLDEELS